MLVEKTPNVLVRGSKDVQVYEINKPVTVNQMIKELGLTFNRPFVFLLNGKPVSRKDWDTYVIDNPKYVGRFVVLPQGGGSGSSNPLRIVAMIALAALAIYTGGLISPLYGPFAGALASSAVMAAGSLLINAIFPATSSLTSDNSIESRDTVYSIGNDANGLKIGQPFPEHFGRMIAYPCLVQQPYTTVEAANSSAAIYYLGEISLSATLVGYSGLAEVVSLVEDTTPGQEPAFFFYFIGIIGVGEYDVEGVYIEDTPMDDYDESIYEVLAPGDTPTIVPRLAYTCASFGGQELDTDWLTAVLTNPGVSIQDIEADIIFPGGLGYYDDEGNLTVVSVPIVIQARTVDDTGASTNDWVTIFSHTYSYATVQTLRFSHRVSVPYGSGRYEMRIRRTTTPSTNDKVIDIVNISGAKGFGPNHPDYGNVTLLECRLKATDKLNGSVANKINVIATRKLKTVTESGLSGSVATTRSIVDAAVHIYSDENGGNIDADTYVDFESLTALRSILEGANYHFDWRFSSRTTVMAALKKAARLGRCLPYTPGGLFTLVQDKKQYYPSISFDDEDISENTLRLSHTILTDQSPTCVKVFYTDPNSWETQEVLCYDENGNEQVPYEITLEGCCDRQHAYEIGYYIYQDYLKNRTQVEFETGLKGHLPSVVSKILVQASMCDWGQTGKVLKVENNVWHLSNPVSFNEETSGNIFITDDEGGTLGPFVVLPTVNAKQVIGVEVEGLRDMETYDLAGTSYIFGPLSEDPLYIRFLSVRPASKNRILITGDLIDDSIYEDPGDAPAIGEAGQLITLLDFMEVQFLEESSTGYLYRISWTGSSAQFDVYAGPVGGSYVKYSTAQTLFYYDLDINETNIKVKVVPYTDDSIPVPDTGEQKETTLELLESPTLNAVLDFVKLSLSWTALTQDFIIGYNISLYDAGLSLIKTYFTTNDSYEITVETLLSLGLTSSFTVELTPYGVNATVLSDSQLLSFTAPAAPANLALVDRLSGGVSLTWDEVDGADGYGVWLGTSASFTTSAGSLVTLAPGTSAVAPADMSGDYDHFFQVAGYNDTFYYDEPGDLNVSEIEVTPPAVCVAGMLTDLSVEVDGTTITLSWGGTATQFDILVEQEASGSTDIEITQMTGSQRIITGLEVGNFTATVTPYASDGTLCTSQEDSVSDTVS